MAINKKLIHFNTFSNFCTKNLSANENNTTWYKYNSTTGEPGVITTVSAGSEVDIKFHSIVFIKDTRQIWTHGALYDCSNEVNFTIGEGLDLVEIVGEADKITVKSADGSILVEDTGISTNAVIIPCVVENSGVVETYSKELSQSNYNEFNQDTAVATKYTPNFSVSEETQVKASVLGTVNAYLENNATGTSVNLQDGELYTLSAEPVTYKVRYNSNSGSAPEFHLYQKATPTVANQIQELWNTVNGIDINFGDGLEVVQDEQTHKSIANVKAKDGSILVEEDGISTNASIISTQRQLTWPIENSLGSGRYGSVIENIKYPFSIKVTRALNEDAALRIYNTDKNEWKVLTIDETYSLPAGHYRFESDPNANSIDAIFSMSIQEELNRLSDNIETNIMSTGFGLVSNGSVTNPIWSVDYTAVASNKPIIDTYSLSQSIDEAVLSVRRENASLILPSVTDEWAPGSSNSGCLVDRKGNLQTFLFNNLVEVSETMSIDIDNGHGVFYLFGFTGEIGSNVRKRNKISVGDRVDLIGIVDYESHRTSLTQQDSGAGDGSVEYYKQYKYIAILCATNDSQTPYITFKNVLGKSLLELQTSEEGSLAAVQAYEVTDASEDQTTVKNQSVGDMQGIYFNTYTGTIWFNGSEYGPKRQYNIASSQLITLYNETNSNKLLGTFLLTNAENSPIAFTTSNTSNTTIPVTSETESAKVIQNWTKTLLEVQLKNLPATVSNSITTSNSILFAFGKGTSATSIGNAVTADNRRVANRSIGLAIGQPTSLTSSRTLWLLVGTSSNNNTTVDLGQAPYMNIQFTGTESGNLAVIVNGVKYYEVVGWTNDHPYLYMGRQQAYSASNNGTEADGYIQYVKLTRPYVES